jgi:threonine/homoserine/homoserine lactone efflux protein
VSYLRLFALSFGIAIGPVISPGPVSAAVVTEGARRGFGVGPLISTGHALMELLMVGALALGQALKVPLVAAAVAILGGAFLVWMGGKMGWEVVRRRPGLPRTDEDSGIQVNRGLIGLGIVTTVSNPFWYVWWVGAGGAYVVSTQQDGLVALAAFYLGHIAADYAWNTFLASVVGSGRRWLSDRVYRAILLVCASCGRGLRGWGNTADDGLASPPRIAILEVRPVDWGFASEPPLTGEACPVTTCPHC